MKPFTPSDPMERYYSGPERTQTVKTFRLKCHECGNPGCFDHGDICDNCGRDGNPDMEAE